MKRTKEIRNNRGITMISLIITIAIMIIIASTTVYTSRGRFEINNLNKMYNDLELLADKVSSYYLKYGALPVLRDEGNNPIQYATNLDINKNPNDNENYYIIDLSALETISLNYGEEGYKNPNESDDVYIINEASHQIYYAQGIKSSGEVFYTRYDDMAENSDAIPPSRPQIKVISGTKNDKGVYTTEVEIEIAPGKDNWSGVARTTYTLDGGSETELKENNSILKITEEGKHTIKAKSYDENNNVSGETETTIEIKKETKKPPTVTASASKAYTNEKHSVTITTTGQNEKGGTLTYNLSFNDGKNYKKEETKTGDAGKEVSFTINDLTQYTKYSYTILVTNSDGLTGSCSGDCRTYCVGTYCSGKKEKRANCNTCGGEGVVKKEHTGIFRYNIHGDPYHRDAECSICGRNCIDVTDDSGIAFRWYLGSRYCGFCGYDYVEDFPDPGSDGASYCYDCAREKEAESDAKEEVTPLHEGAVLCDYCNGQGGYTYFSDCDHAQSSEHYYCEEHGDVVEQLH